MCSLVAGVIIALGIYVRSRRLGERSDDNEQPQTKTDTCLTENNGKLNLIILASRKQESLPELEKIILSQYETTV